MEAITQQWTSPQENAVRVFFKTLQSPTNFNMKMQSPQSLCIFIHLLIKTSPVVTLRQFGGHGYIWRQH